MIFGCQLLLNHCTEQANSEKETRSRLNVVLFCQRSFSSLTQKKGSYAEKGLWSFQFVMCSIGSDQGVEELCLILIQMDLKLPDFPGPDFCK